MSPDLLEYGLRVSTIWLLLLSYYFIWGRKAGFRFQRLLLLGGWLFGMLIPLLPALEASTTLPITNLPSISLAPITAPVATTATSVEEVTTWHWSALLPWVYLAGVLLFGARTLVQGRVVRQCLADGQRSSYAGYPVITSSRISSPFAASGYIFLPEGLSSDLTHTALLHETAHLRARHHYDKTLMTLSSILLWFHPLVWAYRRLLATIHEYEADAVVVQTVPVRTYGLQLLHCSLGPAGSLGLFSSPLKQRIEMITSANAKRQTRLLPVFILALLLGTLVFACSDITENIAPSEAEPVAVEGVALEVPVLQLAPSAEIEDYPRLLNNTDPAASAEDVLANAIVAAIKYPELAIKMGYEGKVRTWVTIDEKGKVSSNENFFMEVSGQTKAESPTHIKVSSIYPEVVTPLPHNVSHSVLVEEVSRAFDTLGDFTPAMRDGIPTPVVLEIFIDFQLTK